MKVCPIIGEFSIPCIDAELMIDVARIYRVSATKFLGQELVQDLTPKLSKYVNILYRA